MRRLARSPKRNKRKVVSGSRVILPENFACKPELSFNPLARVTLALGSSSFHVNRALVDGYQTVPYQPGTLFGGGLLSGGVSNLFQS